MSYYYHENHNEKKKAIFILQINQKASVGFPDACVELTLMAKNKTLIWEVQWLKEHGDLCWVARALDDLSNFGADEADMVSAVMKLTVGHVLKGKPNIMVIEPAWRIQY